MSHAVRCPRCRALSQVGAAAVGRVVACPTCGERFRAAPLPPPPVAAPLAHEPDYLVPDEGLTAFHLGLALLPLGVPLLWLVGRLVRVAEPVFSFAAPLAVGLGMCGLAVGVGLVRRWSHPARVRAALVLAVAGYLIGGALFVVPKDWPAGARKLFGPKGINWKEFKSPDKLYQTHMPADVTESKTGPVGGWELRTFVATAGQPDDKRGIWAVRYVVADGVPPGAAGVADDAWFAAVRDAVVQASGGELTAEEVLTVPDGKPARELRLTLPDRVTHRVVRLVRAKDTLVYAAAEGLFLTADGDEVQRFLGKLVVK